MKKLALLMALLLVAACLLASCDSKKTSSKHDKDSDGTGGFLGDLFFGDSSEGEDTSKGGSFGDIFDFSWGEDSEDSATENPDFEISGDVSEEEGWDSPYQDRDGKYTVDNLIPSVSFDDEAFTILVVSDKGHDIYYSEEMAPEVYDSTMRSFSDAVKARNEEIKKKYGVEIIVYCARDLKTHIMNDVVTGIDSVQAAMPFMKDAADLARKSYLYDLNSLSDLHLEAPWWDQAANEALSIDGKLFFTTGDISVMQKNVANVILFNKNLFADMCAPMFDSLYDSVRNGEWTIELMAEMAALMPCDTSGGGVMTYDDTWGMFGTNDVSWYYNAFGYKMIEKDNKDLPFSLFASLTEPSLVAVYNIFNTFLNNSWYANTDKLSQTWTDNTPEEAALRGFLEGRSLFYKADVAFLKQLGEYEADFGVLPLPKQHTEQETYYTAANISYAYGVCIPVSVYDPYFSAAVLDMLACGAKNYITPAYENAINRYLSDADSVEMLDIIFENIVYDLGVLYDFGGIHSMFEQMMESDAQNVVSYLESIEGAVENAISELVSDYEDW